MAAQASGAVAAAVVHPPFDTARRQLFVIGNEAADVDSLVSAYTLAALLDSTEVQAIALAQIPREEFRLRGDGLLLFRQAGSALAADGSPVNLRFWDEVDWDVVRGLSERSLVLVDHNKMSPKVCDVFDGRVSWVLDHHQDSKAYPDATSEVDESLGSSCTCVAWKYIERSEVVPFEHGRLLAGVILLDCRNFGNTPDENSRGSARDRAAMDRLMGHVPQNCETGWYGDLKKARFDISHLSVRDLLMLDMKLAQVAGFSGPQVAFCAMMISLESCCAKEGSPAAVLETFRSYAVQHGHAAVVANFAIDESGQKALALVPASEAQQPMCDAIEARIAGAPGNLPKSLRDNPLYETQGILTSGFGLVLRSDLAPLRVLSMRKDISRKTMLPRAVSEDDAPSA